MISFWKKKKKLGGSLSLKSTLLVLLLKAPVSFPLMYELFTVSIFSIIFHDIIILNVVYFYICIWFFFNHCLTKPYLHILYLVHNIIVITLMCLIICSSYTEIQACLFDLILWISCGSFLHCHVLILSRMHIKLKTLTNGAQISIRTDESHWYWRLTGQSSCYVPECTMHKYKNRNIQR